MFKRVLPVALAAAAIAAAAASAAPVPTSFADPVGDNGAAPDLAGVTVSNDAAGAYTFDVTFATDYAPDGQFYLYLDTDEKIAYCWHPKLRILVGTDWWCQWWEKIED